MNSRWRFLVLPLVGALSAVIAFAAAQPFVNTLDNRDLPIGDPASHFSTGTTWDIVEHIVFGALLCGLITYFLSAGRGRRVLTAVIGCIAGAVVVPLANSGADLLGMSLERKLGPLMSIFAGVIWCVLVPTCIAFTIATVMGLTPQRLLRALFASGIGFMATLIAHYILGPILTTLFMRSSMSTLVSGDGMSAPVASLVHLSNAVPMWEAMDMAVGFVMGLVFVIADAMVRTGTIRLEAGRNEYRDWALDYVVNRIGTDERAEIPLKGLHGVEPIHAQVVRQGQAFILDHLGNRGVLVNGTPVNDYTYLNSGDRLTMGSANLLFLTRDGGSPPQSSRGSDPARNYLAPVQPVLLTSPQVPVIPVASFSLQDSTGLLIPLAVGRYKVGRDQTCDIVVNESSVSRAHAEIIVEQGSVTVTDLQSTNGTFVNLIRVQQAQLTPGDTLGFGSAIFRVQT